MQKNTVFESPEQEEWQKKTQGAGVAGQEPNPDKVSTETLPSIEFLPYIDEVEEKRKFWKTVIITILVFALLSSAVIGYVLTQRLSQPSKPKINIQYIDSAPRADVTIKIQVTARPTRAPKVSNTRTPVTPIAQVSRVPTKRPSGGIPYVVIGTGTPAAIPLRTSTTLTPTKTLAPGQSQPTTNPSITPLPTVTPTTSTGPTPTPYLYSTSDGTSGVSFGYVELGSSVSSVIQLMNLGGSSFTISTLTFATTGSANPYLLSGGGDGSCLTSSALPYVLPAGGSKCLSIHFEPNTTTTNTNQLLIFWSGSSQPKSISLSGNASTPTPTRTPTPTT